MTELPSDAQGSRYRMDQATGSVNQFYLNVTQSANPLSSHDELPENGIHFDAAVYEDLPTNGVVLAGPGPSKDFTILSSSSNRALQRLSRLRACRFCDKSFPKLSDLERHERVHTGSRPFVCDICIKAFTDKSNLRAHKRIHTGDRPFVCKICSKRFTQSANLREHERRHTGGSPFLCEICYKTFNHSSSLRRHKLLHIQMENR